MDEKERRKEVNRRALKTVAIIGGSAFLIVFSTMLISVISKNISDKKNKENNQNNTTQYIENNHNFDEIMHF